MKQAQGDVSTGILGNKHLEQTSFSVYWAARLPTAEAGSCGARLRTVCEPLQPCHRR